MDMGLTNKIILVTGGGAGIGGAISEALAAEGAIPVILARRAPDPAFMARLRPQAIWIKANLALDQDCRAAVHEARTRFGRIDGLVNNAGTNDGVGLEAGPEAFRASLDQNLLHYYTLAHLCLEDLKASKGAIVNISSKTALTGQGSTSAYVAAKAAQLGLPREWAAALAPHGVRVNAVRPGIIDTDIHASGGQPGRAQASAGMIPMQRPGTAEEVAAAIVWLLSDSAGYTTGAIIDVSGGR